MSSSFRFAFIALAAVSVSTLDRTPGFAQASQDKKIALVIGESEYRAGVLPEPANDAGLIASTLQQAGFDVVGARDLDQDSMRRAFRDFLQKAQAAGPRTIAFVYLAGYGLQYDGDNYIVPIDATIARGSDAPIQAVRLSDFMQALSGLTLRARIFVLDAARPNPFSRQGAPLAGGLALVAPDAGSLLAFNAAPGTVATTETGPYGSYARALAEALRQPGAPAADIFEQARLRTNELTDGREVPWADSALASPTVLVDAAPGAPPPPILSSQNVALLRRPLNELTPDQAYLVTLDQDTLPGYVAFLAAFPHDPLAGRVRGMLAARREALTWRQTVLANRPNAYWTYLRRYPHGPHGPDAVRRLELLRAAAAPPPRFDPYVYEDLPAPPPDEVVIIDRGPVVIFDERGNPPPPTVFIGRRPPDFDRLPNPERAERPNALPTPTIAIPFNRDARIPPRPRPAAIPLPASVAARPAESGPPPVGGARPPQGLPARGGETPSAGGPARRPPEFTGGTGHALPAPAAVAPLNSGRAPHDAGGNGPETPGHARSAPPPAASSPPHTGASAPLNPRAEGRGPSDASRRDRGRLAAPNSPLPSANDAAAPRPSGRRLEEQRAKPQEGRGPVGQPQPSREPPPRAPANRPHAGPKGDENRQPAPPPPAPRVQARPEARPEARPQAHAPERAPGAPQERAPGAERQQER